MNKLLALILIGTVSYAGTHITKVKRKSDLLDIYFKAQIKNITNFMDDSRVRVKSKEYGRVTIRLKLNQAKSLKENDYINIKCKEKNFGAYENCDVFKSY